MPCSSKVSKSRRHWVHGARVEVACRCRAQARKTRVGVSGFMVLELGQNVDAVLEQSKQGGRHWVHARPWFIAHELGQPVDAVLKHGKQGSASLCSWCTS